MCKDDGRCNSWISLRSNGIDSEGCIHDTSWLYSLKVRCTQSIFDQNLYINTDDKKLRLIKNIAHGKFGFIDISSYEVNGELVKEVFVKRPMHKGKNLLYEACIQKIVYHTLKKGGFPTGAPKVFDIFKLKDGSVCFSMEQLSERITLQNLLEYTDSSNITPVIIDCLLQVCAMLWLLEVEIGLNHRDLKPNNLLILKHEPCKKTLKICSEVLEITSCYSVSFIDFGFSCVGYDSGKVNVSLSNVYEQSDPCPKEGRDLYLFLAFMFIELGKKLPDDLAMLFEHWLQIPKSNITTFLKKYGAESTQWIYFLTGNPSIRKFSCTPLRIVRDLKMFITSH